MISTVMSRFQQFHKRHATFLDHSLLIKWWPYFAVVLATLIIELPQLENGNAIIGTDTIFHFNRFYEDAEQIEHHTFNYWISVYGFHHSARMVNAVYSPYLSYILGFLLLCCHTFTHFQILTDFLVPLLAAISLHCGFHIAGLYHKQNNILLIIYPLTYQVFHWNISDNFTSVGAIVIPLVIGCLVRMLRNKTNQIAPLQFGMLTALVVQVHLITALQCLMLDLLIIPVAFAIAKYKGRFLKDLSISVLIGALLCLNLIVAVWGELFDGNSIAPLSQLTFGQDRSFTYASSINGEFMNTAMFIVLLVLFLTTLAVNHWQANYIGGLGLFFFLLSSTIVPWHWIMTNIPGANVIQYPSRFLVPAVCLTCFFVAMAFNSQMLTPWYHHIIVMALAIFIVSAIVSNYKGTRTYSNRIVFSTKNVKFKNEHNWRAASRKASKYFSESNLPRAMNYAYQGTSDYMPLVRKYKTNPYLQAYRENLNNIYNFKHPGVSIKQDYDYDYVKLNIESKKPYTLKLPEVAYQGTNVVINGASVETSPMKHSKGSVNRVAVPLNEGHNTVSVSYKPNPADSIGVAVNCVLWILVILILLSTWLWLVLYHYVLNHPDTFTAKILARLLIHQHYMTDSDQQA